MIKITNEEYHARPELSNTNFSDLHETPATFHYFQHNEKEETRPFVFGQEFHHLIFEPDLYDETRLKPAEIKRIHPMVASLKQHGYVQRLLSVGEAELSFIGELNGVPVKCRPDWLRSDITVNLKSAANVRPRKWRSDAYQFGYGRGAALTLHILNQNGYAIGDYLFIVVQKSAPFLCEVYRADRTMLEIGMNELYELTEIYKECKERNHWPGYSDPFMDVSVPECVLRQQEGV